jgi:selenocysteine-specific elongation factor
MYVLGTAGHVDHGKSTLVKALTGIDPDRLKEEKDRQMTIDLGFAWYQLPSGNEVGIVDVPGHRDFIENMLVGVGGIDAVLLVIAADEGVMPQTREHLDILQLLQIKEGLIVLTKIDLVDDPDWLELVESDVRNLVRSTFLADAPILKVSAMTGIGMIELGIAIDKMLANCPPKTNKGKPRLPIDRVFTVKGFGTVVTGTLLDGEFNTGQQVEIQPEGLQARIRGLQNHKKAIDIALPGNRTAINLAGVDTGEIQRGSVVVRPGDYQTTRRLDVKIEMLAGASADIKHNDHLKCFIGAAQTTARIRILGVKEIKPGESGWVQMEFESPLIAEKGDRLILRRPSPGETIAGGVVLNNRSIQRYKRFAEATLEKMNLMEDGSAQQVLLANLDAKGPIGLVDFMKVGGIEEKTIQGLIDQMNGSEILLIKSDKERDPLLVTRKYWDGLEKSIMEKLNRYYQDHPLRSKMDRNELANFLKINQKHFNWFLRQMVNDGLLIEEGGLVGISGREVTFSAEHEKAAGAILMEFQVNPFSPPTLNELSARYDPDLLPAMIGKGLLIQLNDEITFLPESYKRMVAEITGVLQKDSKITLAQVRDMFKTSRKYALAMLEHLDQSGVTRRQEDYRVLNHG